MKRIQCLILSILVLCGTLVSCQKNPPKYSEPLNSADNEEVSISTETKKISQGDIIIATEIDSVIIEADSDLTQRIAKLTSDWRANALSTAQTTVNEYRREYFSNNPKSFWLTIDVTYNKNGIISLACVLSYSYFGNTLDIYIGAETIRLEDGYSLTIYDVLSCEKSLLENILTLGITPMLNESYPEEILNSGGRYSEICNFYVDREGISVFVCYPYLDRERCELITKITYSGNEELFAFVIFDQ